MSLTLKSEKKAAAIIAIKLASRLVKSSYNPTAKNWHVSYSSLYFDVFVIIGFFDDLVDVRWRVVAPEKTTVSDVTHTDTH